MIWSVQIACSRARWSESPRPGCGPGWPSAAARRGPARRPGIELLLELASFGSRLDEARLVITGEGSLDAQTLHGKVPVGVARAAMAHDPIVPVVAVAGRCTLTEAELRRVGIARAYALTELEPDLARCIARAGPLLERVAEHIAADWLGPRG